MYISDSGKIQKVLCANKFKCLASNLLVMYKWGPCLCSLVLVKTDWLMTLLKTGLLMTLLRFHIASFSNWIDQLRTYDNYRNVKSSFHTIVCVAKFFSFLPLLNAFTAKICKVYVLTELMLKVIAPWEYLLPLPRTNSSNFENWKEKIPSLAQEW